METFCINILFRVLLYISSKSQAFIFKWELKIYLVSQSVLVGISQCHSVTVLVGISQCLPGT